jgi:protein-tyrosine phosphatase
VRNKNLKIVLIYLSNSVMKYIIILLLCPLCVTAQITDSAQRCVKVRGAVNMRDLGGYTTKDGKTVKWGKLYRSADLSKLTDADLDTFQQRKIDYIVDLRGTNESKAAPDKMNPNTDYILCPAGSDQNLNDWMVKLASLQSGGDSMMIVYYSNTTYLADRYKPFFDKLLALPDDQALLFHCTAGKDRTGIGAALLLYALGVPYETIIQDYTASNEYRKESNETMVAQMVKYTHVNKQVAEDVVSVKPEYLNATFDAIRKQYGSIDNFLKGPLGLDETKLAMLKSKFLE